MTNSSEVLKNTLEERAKKEITIVHTEINESIVGGLFGGKTNYFYSGYWIAPKEGIYVPGELNEILESLIPKPIENLSINRFSLSISMLDSKSYITPGSFRFWESELGRHYVAEVRLFPNFNFAKLFHYASLEKKWADPTKVIYFSEIKKYCNDLRKRIRAYEKEEMQKQKLVGRGEYSMVPITPSGSLEVCNPLEAGSLSLDD